MIISGCENGAAFHFKLITEDKGTAFAGFKSLINLGAFNNRVFSNKDKNIIFQEFKIQAINI